MLEKTFQFIVKYKNSLMWALVILILCGMPPSGLPTIKIPGIDKMVHFGLFVVFALLLISEMNYQRNQLTVKNQHKWLGFIVASVYGGLIELAQLYLFTSRGAEWADFFADILGAATAALVYPSFNRTLRGYI